MKLPYFILIIFFYCGQLTSQNFEGKISYKNTFISKSPNLDKEKFEKMIGTNQDYYIKKGKYLSVANGYLSAVQLYNNVTNKVYNKTMYSDTIYCFSASIENNKIIETKFIEETEIVLGYECKVLTMKSSNGTLYKYYFSEKLRVNPLEFEAHNYSYWNIYLRNAKAIPLKTIMENNQFKMESVATSIESMKLDDSKFDLPSGSIIKCR